MRPQAGAQLGTPDAVSGSVAPRRPGGTAPGSQRSQRFMPDCEALSREDCGFRLEPAAQPSDAP
jgi:hypothetical protein